MAITHHLLRFMVQSMCLLSPHCDYPVICICIFRRPRLWGLQYFILSGLTGNVTSTSALTSASYAVLKVVDCGFTTRFSTHMRSFTALEAVILRKISLVTFSSSKDCSSLTSVNMPNQTAVTESMFEGCSSLVSIFLPVMTYCMGNNGFRYYTALTSVSLLNVYYVTATYE